VRFHEVHLADGSRIQHRRFCSKENKPVEYKEVVKGYEVAEGEWVILSDEDVKAAAGDRGHEIAIEQFVGLDEIEPVVFDHAYYVGCGNGGERVYRLLHDAMQDAGRAGIGRFTFHNREYLAAVRAYDGVLALHTLRFADELVGPEDVPLDEPKKAPSDREVQMARALVESLHARFEPDRYEDTYRQAVLELIDAKARGKQVTPPKAPEPEVPDDLLAALQASLGDARGGGKRKKAAA
jgi:DNA end-binding protein Ku